MVVLWETQTQCMDVSLMGSTLSVSDVAKVSSHRAWQDFVVAADTPLNHLFTGTSCYEQELL